MYSNHEMQRARESAYSTGFDHGVAIGAGMVLVALALFAWIAWVVL